MCMCEIPPPHTQREKEKLKHIYKKKNQVVSEWVE